MKKGDVVSIYFEKDGEEGWFLRGTAKVKSVNGSDITYESLPSGVQPGDIVIAGESH